MSLQIAKSQPFREMTILTLTGKLLLGADCHKLEHAIDDLIAEGTKRVVIDMASLDGIDSTGAGILVVLHGKLHKVGGSLRIAGAQGIVHEALSMIHIDRLVPFYATAQEASQSLATP